GRRLHLHAPARVPDALHHLAPRAYAVYRVRQTGLEHLPETGAAVLVCNHVSFVDALVEHAFDEVARALDAGELVCIFPEGRIPDTGELAPFRPGVERIVARTPVPVVPMALRGLRGGFFSRKDGRAMRRPFRRVWSRIELVCAAPVPASEATSAAPSPPA